MTAVAQARTFRLPEGVAWLAPDDIPTQHVLAAEPCAADELAAYEQLEMWDQLAGLLLRDGAACQTVRLRRRYREAAETVAEVARELAEALAAVYRVRTGHGHD